MQLLLTKRPIFWHNNSVYMLFEIGEKVIHCRDGLATITEKISMNGKDFYLVSAQRGGSETIFVPVDRAELIIRPIMKKEEAEKVIEYMNSIEFDFNRNTKQRRDLFKKKLSSGEINEIAYLYRQYYLYKKHPDEVKLGPADIDMLEYATKNILDEFALTYDLPIDKVQEFLNEKMK